jgi:Toastrack DUF4097
MNGRTIMALLALAAIPRIANGDQTWREQSRRVEPAAGLELLVVENARGRIEVRPSGDQSLHITALKVARAASTVEAQKIARAATVELEHDGSRYTVRVRYPQRESLRVNFWDGFDLSMPRLEVRLTIEVPDRIAVQLQASSGDVITQDLKGDQRLHASSGDVSVDGAEGRVDVSTSSGDVTLVDSREARVSTSSGDVDVTGRADRVTVTTGSGDVSVGEADSLHVQTTSGEVSVERASEGATVQTSSGEVSLLSAAGRLSVSTVSGEIKMHVTGPLRDGSLVSSSGDIRLGLDPGVACTLDVRTSSGSLDIDVPMRSQTLTRQRVTGVVREGGPQVHLRSTSGSIAVVSGEP